MDEPEARRFPGALSIGELRGIVTRALASGDEYSRVLLREQLIDEEFAAATE